MIFIKNSEEYPLFIGDLLSENPEWSPGDSLPDNWEIVYETEKPGIAAGYKVTELFPTKEDRAWIQSWNLVEMTEQEIASMAIKDIPINPETT